MNSDIIKNKYCERVKEILKYTDIAIFSDSTGKRLCHRGHIHDTIFELNKLNFSVACSVEITNIGIEIIEPGMSVNESRYLFDVEKDVYDDFKKVIDDRDDMHSFVYSVAGFTDDENAKAYLYFNKNKLKLNFFNIDDWTSDFIPEMFLYNVNMCNINTTNTLTNKDLANLLLEDINSVLYLLKTLNCDEETKLKYYKELIKVMSRNRKFKERCEEITSFEEKIKIIEIYKNIRKER